LFYSLGGGDIEQRLVRHLHCDKNCCNLPALYSHYFQFQ